MTCYDILWLFLQIASAKYDDNNVNPRIIVIIKGGTPKSDFNPL